LGLLKLFQGGVGVLLTANYFDHPGRPVGPHVVANDGVGGVEIVACQIESVCSLPKTSRSRNRLKDEKAISPS
jgi:hypothetical protein